MFSFHRPRVYRSVNGCCICRAKSSSSRFTDSKRYEDVFFECFRLKEVRTGEICNACVLLVKRWKKLPKGSQRHWNHVVDARAGHGSKPLSKIHKNKVGGGGMKIKTLKAKVKEAGEGGFPLPIEVTESIKKKIYIPRVERKRAASPSGLSDDVQLECMSSGSGSYQSSVEASPVPSPGPLDDVESVVAETLVEAAAQTEGRKGGRRRNKSLNPQKNRVIQDGFLDLTFWKREKTCCGTIFKGPFGEVLIDRRYLNPCGCRSNASSSLPSPECESEEPLKEENLNCFEIDAFEEDNESTGGNGLGIREYEANKQIGEVKPDELVGSPLSAYDGIVD